MMIRNFNELSVSVVSRLEMWRYLKGFQLLDTVHQQFFEAYDNPPPGKGKKAGFSSIAQPLSALHDVRVRATPTLITCEGSCFPQVIIHGLRLQTFDGLHIVFSSLIPLDTRPESADIWNLAEAFGATCHIELTGEVTHLVAAKACLFPSPHFFSGMLSTQLTLDNSKAPQKLIKPANEATSRLYGSHGSPTRSRVGIAKMKHLT
jgi:hypothetical protein